MKKHLLITSCSVVCLGAAVFFSGCSSYRGEHKKTENASVLVGDAAELRVETGVGSITVTGADVNDCNITAEITVKAETSELARQLAEQVRIEAEPSGDKLIIKASKPADLKKRPLEVKFEIVAPKRLKVNCSINVGDVNISDTDNRIEVSGNVTSVFCRQTACDVHAKSNVGSVEVDYADAASGLCNVDITTNVGSIEIATPARLSAQVSASTNVGSIETDKPMTVVGTVGKSVKGTIGAGEGRIRLKTNVGSIRIK